jgi:hypothetical protein
MDPWFQDLPLDFTREETKSAEQLLLTGYPMNMALLQLAQNAGLDLAALNQMAQMKFLVREVLTQARVAARLEQLMVEVVNDPVQAALHPRVRALYQGHEQLLVAAHLARKPSIATLARLPLLGEVWHPDQDHPAPLTDTATFEKVVNFAAGFSDPAEFRTGLATAEVRTARVEIGGKPKGTGFLVGESLLLTNWHVVGGAATGAARFDKSLTGGDGRLVPFADDWLVAKSPHHPKSLELGGDGPPDDMWDFALVRLAAPVGSQAVGLDPEGEGDARGHYALGGVVYEYDDQEPILIVGHPLGRPVQFSYASPARATLTKHGSRVRYQTNTDAGSSGSPVFNKEWKLVTLHHGAGPTKTPGALDMETADFNQGIPIAKVVDSLREQLDSRPELAELGLE